MTTKTPMKAIAALAGAASLAVAVPAAGAHATPRQDGARLQQILDRAAHNPKTAIPGVALYVRRPGHEAWSGAAGKMRRSDRFRAGSIMKAFVATATLQLVEQGRLGLDDPLPAVLDPGAIARFPEAGRITVRMLLDHTSGLGEYSDEGFNREVLADPLRRWSTAELLDRAAAQPRAGAPGERFSYANANYNLLGLILERATGQPWRTVVRERVIQRLHLRNTSLPQSGHMPADRGIAHGYEPVDGRMVDVTEVDSSMAGAAGGHALLTTTKDLTTFVRATVDGRLFRHRATREAMQAFVPATDEHARVGYGLGLERYVLPGGVEMVGHMGTTGGYRALMFHLPARNVDFTMVTTAPSDPAPVLIPALKLLLAGG